jgi:hypothetical protein
MFSEVSVHELGSEIIDQNSDPIEEDQNFSGMRRRIPTRMQCAESGPYQRKSRVRSGERLAH